ncbi:ABC transporter ATP-binding protein [Lactovum odontotermitis]
MLSDVRYLLQFVSKKKLILFGLAMIANSLLGLATALIVQHAAQMQGITSLQKILIFGLVSAGLYAYVAIAILFGMTVENWLVYGFSVNITMSLMRKFMQHKTEMKNSEKVSVLNLDMDLFESFYIIPILDIPYQSVVFVTPLLYMLSQNVWLGILFAAGTFCLILPQLFLNNRLQKYGKEVSDQKSVFLEKMTDMMNGRKTIIKNQSTEPALLMGEKYIKKRAKAELWSSFSVNLIFALSSFLRIFSEIVPFVVGIILIAQGSSLAFPVLLALFSASQQLKTPLQNIISDYAYIQQYTKLKEKIYHLLKLPEMTLDERLQDGNFNKLVISGLGKAFSGKKIFEKFFWEIPYGKKVLVKGESGSGKSTLLRLIAGEIDKDAGEVYLLKDNGEKIQLKPDYFGWIDQEPFLFNETIRYNLTLGQSFTDQQLEEALNEVNLSDISLDFLVKNNGDNISGGQRIRLELARFLLRKKCLLLVDEVTAALDSENSRKIRDLILNLPSTIIEVAHHIDDESRYDDIINLERRWTE